MDGINEKNITRLVLKKDDVLLIQLPKYWFELNNRRHIDELYKQIRKKLLPKRNKILVIPEEIKLKVIGKDEVNEYISNVDIWNLFDESD